MAMSHGVDDDMMSAATLEAAAAAHQLAPQLPPPHAPVGSSGHELMSNMDLVRRMLDHVGLPQYADAFEAEGYDSLAALREASEEELLSLKVKKGHIRLLKNGVHSFQMAGKLPLMPKAFPPPPPAASVLSPSKPGVIRRRRTPEEKAEIELEKERKREEKRRRREERDRMTADKKRKRPDEMLGLDDKRRRITLDHSHSPMEQMLHAHSLGVAVASVPQEEEMAKAAAAYQLHNGLDEHPSHRELRSRRT